MKAWYEFTPKQIKTLSEEAYEIAINSACLHIQEVLRIPTGDVAGVCFSNEIEELKKRLIDYIETEIQFKEEA